MYRGYIAMENSTDITLAVIHRIVYINNKLVQIMIFNLK